MTKKRQSDVFDRLAQSYARYRPQYPPALFAYLASIAPKHDFAWDCGTGSGQAAVGLAEYFTRVWATDSSQPQIENAMLHPRVTYAVSPAEHTVLSDSSVDLVTAAQAAHWFDLPRFYAEVKRVLSPRGVLAVWCYQLIKVSPSIDEIVIQFNREVVGPYGEPCLHYVDDAYATLPFPFAPIEPPKIAMETQWNLADLLGFMGSWSPSGQYNAALDSDPLDQVRADLALAWGDPEIRRSVHWPLYLRIGRAIHEA